VSTAETVTTLEALRREIAKQRSKAALVPGLTNLLNMVEAHLVATDHRLQRLEEVRRG